MVRSKKFKADRFWVMAHDRMDILDKEEEVRKRDLTLVFWTELRHKVKNKELININVNGNVRLGKSTVGMEICRRIKQDIEKYHGHKRPMSNRNVTRDQNEYSRMVKRRPESFKHECDVIDEWAEMELAGYNATIEQKYLKQFSDVQAGRYYHRIACSPTTITDDNSDIVLSIVPGGRRDGETLCLIYYRMHRIVDPILLGHVIIDVRKTLKANWYQEYLIKKEDKWELMNKHNVMSPRQLEYAQIIINTYNAVKGDCELGLTQRKHLKIDLQDQADKVGVWFSILGDKDILETLEGLADRTHILAQLRRKVLKTKNPVDKIRLGQRVERIKERLGEILKRQAKLAQLWEEYQLI